MRQERDTSERIIESLVVLAGAVVFVLTSFLFVHRGWVADVGSSEYLTAGGVMLGIGLCWVATPTRPRRVAITDVSANVTAMVVAACAALLVRALDGTTQVITNIGWRLAQYLTDNVLRTMFVTALCLCWACLLYIANWIQWRVTSGETKYPGLLRLAAYAIALISGWAYCLIILWGGS